MTKLLVSVRSADECESAIRGGAAVVDVKEPERGALGAASAVVIRQIAEQIDGRRPLSVALGELTDADPLTLEMRDAIASARYAKFGLARAGSDWPERLRERAACLPQGVEPIVVAYADWHTADAPPPAEVLRRASTCGVRGLLCDTFAKRGNTLFDHLTLDALAQLASMAHDLGLLVAMAGSLRSEHVSRLAELEIDLIGVRASACRGGRLGPIDESLVQKLVSACGRLSEIH